MVPHQPPQGQTVCQPLWAPTASAALRLRHVTPCPSSVCSSVKWGKSQPWPCRVAGIDVSQCSRAQPTPQATRSWGPGEQLQARPAYRWCCLLGSPHPDFSLLPEAPQSPGPQSTPGRAGSAAANSGAGLRDGFCRRLPAASLLATAPGTEGSERRLRGNLKMALRSCPIKNNSRSLVPLAKTSSSPLPDHVPSCPVRSQRDHRPPPSSTQPLLEPATHPWQKHKGPGVRQIQTPTPLLQAALPDPRLSASLGPAWLPTTHEG